MQQHLAISKLGIGRTAFALAAALYALFSSPTPDAPGLLEGGIIALLALATLSGGITKTVFINPSARTWSYPLLALLIWGFGAGALVGALAGHAPADIARDAIGFGTLALPLLLGGLFQDRAGRRILFYSLLGIGFCFAVRFLFTPPTPQGHDLLYLANSPLVFLAAACALLYGAFLARPIWQAAIYMMAATAPIIAMAGMMQRATLALLVLAFGAFWVHAALHRPKRAAALLGALGLLLWGVWPLFGTLAMQLADKTLTLGWNARGPEFTAMFETLSATPITAIMGTGFGSLFRSPAAGDVWVRFAHGFFTALFWKSGWVGLLLGLWAMGAIFWGAIKNIAGQAVLTSALILSALAPLFLYGSYKSLCFGFLLLALTLRIDINHQEVLTKNL